MTANSARRWHIHPHDSDSIASFARSINVPPLVAVLLSVRGLDHPDAARIFLDAPLNGMHDPSLLPGAAEAAASGARAAWPAVQGADGAELDPCELCGE